ncbi:MAG: hypothetical protein U5K75_11825 [Ahrensia sp.]|nr:hypothetical protein [Ahrensia sp.]
MEIDIAIEKARAKLLRLVLCWLIAASFFKSQKTRALPRRLGRWVNAQIFKAELATHYLQIALGIEKPN